MRSLNKDILNLALPSILANITIPLVGMVDIGIAGHLSNRVAAGVTAGVNGVSAAAMIGGMTIGAMLFDLLYWNFAFLRVGTGGLTAQAFGRAKKVASDNPLQLRECADIFSRALGIALASSVVLIAVQWLVVQLAFLFVKCSPEVYSLATQYFYIRIWAAPATLSLFAFKGWFIGMQDTLHPMFTDLIVNGVNIFAGITLSHRIGFSGIALGTLIAQYTGLIYASCVVLLKYRRSAFKGYHLSDFIAAFKTGEPGQGGFRNSEIGKFFVVNNDLFIRSICMVVIYIGFTALSARYGDDLLAASSIMMNLLLLFSYFTDGFAYAGEALTGKFVGMQDRGMTAVTVKYVFSWSMAIAFVFVFIYAFTGVGMVRLMTSDPEVVAVTRQFLPWLVAVPLLGCPAFTWDGIFVGATASKELRDSTLWSVVAFFAVWMIGIAVMGPLMPGDARAIHILLAAYFAHLILRTAYMTAHARRAVLVRPFEDPTE